MAQTSITAICNEKEHPARFQPSLGKKGKQTPLHPREQNSSATNFMWNWGKKENHILLLLLPYLLLEIITPLL